MSTPSECNPCCTTPETVNVPGSAGQSAYTTVTTAFVIPALGGQVQIVVGNTDWMAIGMALFIPDAGLFEVINIVNSTTVVVEYMNIASNTEAGDTVAAGSKVVSGGTPGADGTDGLNAFTVTTADFTVPAIGATVSIAVGSSQFLTIGQTVFVAGAGYFEVTAKADTTHFTGEYLDVSGNTHATENIVAGAAVSPGGPELTTPITVAKGGTNSATATLARAALGIGGANLSVYAAGTAYQFTNTAALLNFGTTDPSLTITSPGVWLLLACVRVDYNAATFAAVRTGTLKLRRTNNTAADLANGSRSFLTDIITTLTYTLGVIALPPVIYTTTNSDDNIQIFGDVSVIPSAGSLDAVQAEIVAIKLFDQTV